MVYFLENNNFPRFQRGSNILRGGGRGGGVQMLISVETYQNFDFPLSPGPPIPSLYPRMFCLYLQLGPSNRYTFVGCVQAWRDGTKFSLIYTCKGRAVAQW